MDDNMTSSIDTIQNIAQSDVLMYVVVGVLAYLAVLWIALIIWVARDAVRRTNNLFFQIIAIALNVFLPVFGLLVYLIVRPGKTLVEKYYEDVEHKALTHDVTLASMQCPKCGTEVEREFMYCPVCSRQLRKSCTKCKQNYEIHCKFCPYCGTKSAKAEVVKKKPVTKPGVAQAEMFAPEVKEAGEE